jgi:uncharacterized protein
VDTDFVVRLCRVDADGVSTGIADGIVRASWREAYAGTGRVYEYTLSLWDTALTLGPGERLRVQVTSSCHPRWDRNLNTGKLAHDSDQTAVARQSIHFGAACPSRLTVGCLTELDARYAGQRGPGSVRIAVFTVD